MNSKIRKTATFSEKNVKFFPKSTRAKSAQCVSVFALVVFFMFCFVSPSPAFAVASKGPAQKLARGIVHIAAAIFQIPKEIVQKTADAGDPIYLAPIQGFFEGFGSGIYLGIRQVVSGFTDLFTFWTPAGRDWGPIYEPATLVPEI